jgi:hypothetical protein
MGGDLPPAVLRSFMLGWGSSQARDVLPKGKRKLGIRKFLELAKLNTYLHSWENCGYAIGDCENREAHSHNRLLHILRGHLLGGGFQMSVMGERQVTGGNGRSPSGRKVLICSREVFEAVISFGSGQIVIKILKRFSSLYC